MRRTEDILETIAPKNEKERLIFREAISNILRKINSRNLIDENTLLFKENYKQRKYGGDGFSNDREMRLVALIPTEMAEIAKKIYGDDVIINKKKFREAFVKDEQGQYCLTVDPKSI